MHFRNASAVAGESCVLVLSHPHPFHTLVRQALPVADFATPAEKPCFLRRQGGRAGINLREENY